MNLVQDATTIERILISQASQNKISINGSIELLPLCNMNCDMCYVRLSRSEMESLGRLRTGEEWLAFGKEMLQAGTLFLLLTGGEPLLHPDFKEIYLGLKKIGMILTVNTNATLINEEWAKFFGENKPRRINITLYGADNGAYEKLCHYPSGFDKVINAVKLLREQKVDVRLGCSVTPANAQDIPKMYQIAKELDVPIQTDAYMMPAVRERMKPFDEQNRLLPEEAAAVRIQALRLELGEEKFAEFRLRMLEKIDTFEPGIEEPCSTSCLAGNCSFSVNWQGLLRPCVISTEPASSVFELGFAEAWRRVSEAFLAMRYCSKCSVCALRPLCRPCLVASKVETGDYLGKPEYLCRYAKETERLLREMNI